jgi:polyisoprenoid-binding protein YceI
MKTILLLPLALATFALPRSDAAGELPRRGHEWEVDGVHSSVVFRVKHMNTAWFQGTFEKVSGRVVLDPSKPEAGSVTISIPVDGIDTNNAQRDEHLKGPDFFNGKENPTIAFTSTKITKKGDQFEVTGDLEMAGKKKSVTLVVEKTGEGDMRGKPIMGWMSTFTVKRSDFGMTYGVDKNALGDDVTLMVALETTQPK